MILVDQKVIEKLSKTNQLICEKSLLRGWKVYMPYLGSSHMYLDTGDGKLVHIFSSSPPTVSYASASLVNNKFATQSVLKSNGIDQLNCILVSNFGSQKNEVAKFIDSFKRVVVKPVDSGHGNGITINVDNIGTVEKAIEYAQGFTKSGQVIVQEQFFADNIHDIRLLCIDRKFIAGIERTPASVCGDGVSTVKRLIEDENSKEYRGEPYRSKLAKIDLGLVKDYLGDQINIVPSKGEKVQVIGVANYGKGGETIDITDDVPEWMIDIAEKISNILELDVAGIDFLTSVKLSKSLAYTTKISTVVEVNKCPALSIHDWPTKGIDRKTTDKYLDLIEKMLKN